MHLPFDSNEFSIRNITLKLAYHDNLIPQIFSYLKERKKYIPCPVSLPRNVLRGSSRVPTPRGGGKIA